VLEPFDLRRTRETVAEIDRVGYAHIPGVLSPDEVDRLRGVAERVVHEQWAPGQRWVHALGAAYLHPLLTDLAVDPRLMSVLACALTPNLHLYHSHLDVHPPEEHSPSAWRWHEDGGRQTADLDYRARLSMKIGYWLTDCDEPGYGNLEVIPGSNRWREPLPRTAGTPPPGAIPVLARAGDATVFERRLWHARSTNVSGRTRMVVFFGYAPRWIAQRESPSPAQLDAALGNPLRRQLIGAPDWDSCHVGRAELPLTQHLLTTA
jgi:ectoine hydroxylase